MEEDQRSHTPPRVRLPQEMPRSPRTSELYDMINKILLKVEEIHTDKTKSPRSKIESKIDAAVNNTQLILKQFEGFEKIFLEKQQILNHQMQRLEKDMVEMRIDFENLRKELLSEISEDLNKFHTETL